MFIYLFIYLFIYYVFFSQILCYKLANKCSNNRINTFSLGDCTAYVAFQIIKVDVAPASRAIINQTHPCGLTNILLPNYPEFSGHGLVAVTSFVSKNLKKYNSVYKPFVYSLIIPIPLTYPGTCTCKL